CQFMVSGFTSYSRWRSKARGHVTRIKYRVSSISGIFPPRQNQIHQCHAIKGLGAEMIRKLKSCQYPVYARKKDAKTGRVRTLGMLGSRKAQAARDLPLQYVKH